MVLWSQVVVTLSMLLSCFYNKVITSYLVNSIIVILLVLLSLLLNQ